jgi:hypothetical protein
VYVVESEGDTLVEPWAVTAPTSGAMLSCVASVEFQLSVDDSPFLMELGLARSVTVGRVGAGAGAGGGGGGVGFGGLQPNVKTAAARAVSKPAR